MKIAVSVAVATAAIWALCHYVLFADVVLSYRLTAEVAMVGRTYAGSAVVETRWTQTLFNPLGLADNWTERERGEAVVVDMGEHGVMPVKPDRVPVVIWLRDRLDPSSAVCTELDGTAPATDATPSFPRVQMQMVVDPPTERIDQVLPWLRPILRSDPYGRGSLTFIDLNRRYPERLCCSSPRDLKRNTF